MPSIALQLYTLRTETRKDFTGTLRQVAAMGYPAVEFAGYGGLPPEQVRDLLVELGLEAASTHTSLDALQQDLPGVIALHQTIGCHTVTVPSLPPTLRGSADGYRQAASTLSAIGQRLSEHDMLLCYHNHAFEFEPQGEQTGFDILYGESDPRYLHAQLDVYWAAKAGRDPAAIIRHLGPRCALLHIKDMAADGTFAEVGAGNLDLRGIMAAGDEVGTRWFIVEQDSCQRPPLEAVRISLENLRRWGRI